MEKTRVHRLAKELGVETKDLIAQLDKLGMRGRKPQSALEDDEVARARGFSGSGKAAGSRRRRKSCRRSCGQGRS